MFPFFIFLKNHVQISKVLASAMTSRLRSPSMTDPKLDYMFLDYRCNVQLLEILPSNVVNICKGVTKNFTFTVGFLFVCFAFNLSVCIRFRDKYKI